MARHPHPAAHRGGGTPVERERPASGVRGRTQEPARRTAGQRGLQAGRGRGAGRRLPGRARHQVLSPPRRAPEQAAGQVDRLRRVGGNHAPVRPRHRQYRAAVAGRGGRAPSEEAAARSALGKEGAGRGGAGARHALRPGGLQRAAQELWRGGPARRARAVPARGTGRWRVARRVGAPPAVPGRQPAHHRQGRGAGAQEPPPGRAGGRRTHLRLLRPADPAGHQQRARFRAMVARGQPRQPQPAAPHARGADAARSRRHHHQRVSQGGAAGRRGLRRELPAPARRRARRPDGERAAVRAQPGERGARRMAGARHAQGQAAGAFEEPAAEAAQPLRAAARERGAAGRRTLGARGLRSRQPG